jgi:two-component system response regulator AgrA
LNDILFFETTTKDHKIRIHTCDEQLEFYGTLKEIEKMMSVDYYKSHRSYLVNTKKIKAIDKNKFIIYMINDEVCYISARYLKGLLEKCSI